MAIACAHCHGSHETPAEVRCCWAGGSPDLPADPATGRQSDPLPEAVAEPERSPASRAAARSGDRTSAAGSGPDALARGALVLPDVDPGSAWGGAERIRIGSAEIDDPAGAVDRLRAARDARRRVVIELEPVDFDEVPAWIADPEPHVLGARFESLVEQLHELVWANTVDLRVPEAPRWRLLDMALAAGATPIAEDRPGDIVTPEGRVAWLDGGPPRFTSPIDGVGVLPAVSVAHGYFVPPSGNDTAADLAPDQLAAVTHDTGAARIIAPAGSGKTRVLTERARHLLTRWNLPASAVTLVAFNKRAQEEMRERTADLPALQVRTLNSIALAIVNGTAPFARRPRRWATIDEPEVRRLVGGLVKFPRRRNSDPVAPWIEALGMVRLGLLDPAEVERRADGDLDGFAAFYPRYLRALDQQGLVDFDDQIRRALGVLLTDPAARATARRACRVLLVDEFQDLTPAHLLLVRLLAGPDGAVFGVGDDDQTIYGYNGADPAWLIEFGDLFPGAGAHPLEVNYRCPAGVVEAVDRLLRHNRRRVPKVIRASSHVRPGWDVDPRPDAVAATVEAVRAGMSAGRSPSEIAVLGRVGALLVPVQAALAADGIGFAGGIGLEFMERTAVRAVLAWLRLARAEAAAAALRPDDLREALRRPSHSLHPRIAEWVCEQTDLGGLFRLAGRLTSERDADRVTEFAMDLQALQQMSGRGAPTSDLVAALVDDIGLGGAVASLDTHRRGMNRAAQGDDLTSIRHLASRHTDAPTFASWLREVLAAPRSADGVLLSTVHRVKGQEWPWVVVHHADADQYPHRLAEDVEEERRLFHVALTRASEMVTVTTGRRPTPFVAELTTEPRPEREIRPAATEVAERVRVTRAARATATVEDLDPAAQTRFEALRELRTRLAAGKPAYVVFDNKTLVAIARDVPTTETELRHIPGVGPAKLEKYGEQVLELLREMS